MTAFLDKASVRDAVWTTIDDGLGAFPFPSRHRIPSFKGAKAAAERLFAESSISGCSSLKINPDAPQRYVRHLALKAGITVFVPTPRLQGGMLKLDPETIDPKDLWKASSIKGLETFATDVALDALPPIDGFVVGCVAVTPRGMRCGKGHGFADLESAILGEFGVTPRHVFTTVHDVQVVDGFPTEPHDLQITAFATPTRLVTTDAEVTPKIDWDIVDQDLPILKELVESEPG